MIYEARLLDFKILGLEIAIISAILRSEFQYTIIGVGNSQGIIQFITILPNHPFRFTIVQNFHRASEHHAAKESALEEIDA